MAVLDHHFVQTSNTLSRLWTKFIDAIEAFARARARVDEFEYYNSLSDAELAKQGLRRDNIAAHIFRDRWF